MKFPAVNSALNSKSFAMFTRFIHVTVIVENNSSHQPSPLYMCIALYRYLAQTTETGACVLEAVTMQ
jgi:hypothetical protein